MKYDLKALLKSSEASLTQIVDILNTAPSLMLQSLESSNTAIIIVDMVNGFVKAQCLLHAFKRLSLQFVS